MMDSDTTVRAAVRRQAIPDLSVRTANGRDVLRHTFDRPAVVLFVADDAASMALLAAWRREMDRVLANPRTARILDPHLDIVRFGRCTPETTPHLRQVCADADPPFPLPARMVIGPGGMVRGFAPGRENFHATSFSSLARRFWMIARSNHELSLVNYLERP
jgi:hypothetical protein